MKSLHKYWKHQRSILFLFFQNLWPVFFLDGFKTASQCVFLKGVMQFWNTSAIGCFPPCPTWEPVSSCLALSLGSTDPFLRSMRHLSDLSADDQGIILNAREIPGCEWKLAWAFWIEHVPLLRHTEVKVLFLSTCTHVHTCAWWVSSCFDRSTLWDVVLLFLIIFFPFCFRFKAASSLCHGLDLFLKNLFQFPPDFYKFWCPMVRLAEANCCAKSNLIWLQLVLVLMSVLDV